MNKGLRKLLVFIGLVILAIILWSIMPKEVNETTVTEVPEATLTGIEYVNEQYGISMRYGDEWVPVAELGGGATYFSWDTESRPVGVPELFSIQLSKDIQPQTNFSEASISLYASSGLEQQCLDLQMGETASGTKGGWTVFTLSDAGAGNYYDTTKYRMVKNGSCIEVQTVIHSTALGNYPEDSGITAFDKSVVQGKIDEVLNTIVMK